MHIHIVGIGGTGMSVIARAVGSWVQNPDRIDKATNNGGVEAAGVTIPGHAAGHRRSRSGGRLFGRAHDQSECLIMRWPVGYPC